MTVVAGATWPTGQQGAAQTLLAYDLVTFASAAVELVDEGFWGPSFTFLRMIQDRSEYLVAVTEDPGFAAEYMAAGSVDSSGRLQTVRSGRALGALRRAWLRDGLPADEVALGILAHIESKELGSASVHPTPVTPKVQMDLEFHASNPQVSADEVVAHLGTTIALGALALHLSLPAEARFTESALAMMREALEFARSAALVASH